MDKQKKLISKPPFRFKQQGVLFGWLIDSYYSMQCNIKNWFLKRRDTIDAFSKYATSDTAMLKRQLIHYPLPPPVQEKVLDLIRAGASDDYIQYIKCNDTEYMLDRLDADSINALLDYTLADYNRYHIRLASLKEAAFIFFGIIGGLYGFVQLLEFWNITNFQP